MPTFEGSLNSHVDKIDHPDVSQLLQEMPELAGVLTEAVDQIAKYFPDARLNVELLADPDYDDSEQLFLGISTTLGHDEALDALGPFDRDWWVHQAWRGRGLFCIYLRDE